jgi:hypothetical protein
VLAILSVILTASVQFPDVSDAQIVTILVAGGVLVLATATGAHVVRTRRGDLPVEKMNRFERDSWRMPPPADLPPSRLTAASRLWMFVLRGYLLLAGGLVLARIVQLATTHV